jgi:hypothetical protein
MVPLSKIDVRENILRSKGNVLDILLINKYSNKNIIWATDSYEKKYGKNYKSKKQMLKNQLTGKLGNIIQPRASKSREEQNKRTKEKAEVFTPLSVVKQMNTELEHSLGLPEEHTWIDFVKTIWLEITCGEAPFIASRYNPTANTQKIIKPQNRVGFLDIKLKVISKHVDDKDDWLAHAETALKACYGYEWQGDNLLIARENILFTINDFYLDKFGKNIKTAQLEKFADIISWNIFQMDGLKYVMPMSCKHETKVTPGELTLFGETPDIIEKNECEGCKKNDPFKHNGKYAKIMDWEKNKKVRFVDILRDPNK